MSDQASLNRAQFKGCAFPDSRWRGAQLKGLVDASKELLIQIAEFDVQLSPKERADLEMVIEEYRAEREAQLEAERLVRLEELKEAVRSQLPIMSSIEPCSFEMGSSEGAGYADERPRHEFTSIIL